MKEPFKVIIAGSRDFTDYALMEGVTDNLLRNKNLVEIVSGCARGADKIGQSYAAQRGYKVIKFPADWDRHGKSAGYIRNEQMAKYADALVAFWDGASRGTKHMIDLAKKYGLMVMVIIF